MQKRRYAIRWIDSVHIKGEHDTEGLKKNLHPREYKSIGYLVHEDGGGLTIAQSVSDEVGTGREYLVIAKNSIVRKEMLVSAEGVKELLEKHGVENKGTLVISKIGLDIIMEYLSEPQEDTK